MRRTIKILDVNYSNSLNASKLQEWLANSQNHVALTDHWSVEATKGSNQDGLKLSLGPLRPCSGKVILLKPTRQIMTMHGKEKGLAGRLIDEEGTANFPRDIEKILSGDPASESHLRKLMRESNEIIDGARSVRKSAQGIVDDLKGVFSKEDRQYLRSDDPYPKQLFDKVVHQIAKLTHISMTRYANTPEHAMRGEIYNFYLFRYMTCQFLNTLKTIGGGGQLSPDVDKVINDDYDMTYVAYATYFDGLLSNDNNANLMYGRAVAFLRRLKDEIRRGEELQLQKDAK